MTISSPAARTPGLSPARPLLLGLLTLALAAPAGRAAERFVPDPRGVAVTLDTLSDLTVAAEADDGNGDPTPRRPELVDRATDLRRLFLDLVGMPPTAAEVARFGDGSDVPREEVVEALLADERFGRNWARYWRDVILSARTENNALIAAGPLERYLAGAFNEGRPWDAVVTDLVTAEGDVFEDGRTGLLFAHGGRPEETAAEVSRLFLGLQIQCAQCHDHPWDDWTRDQFHELAAFFPRTAAHPVNNDGGRRSFVVESRDFFPRFARPPGNNRFVGTPEHRMPDLADPEAPGEVMTPTFFVTGKALPLGSRDATRRATLARWITDPENPWFARTFVNRMMAELTGRGFYRAVDDLGPTRPVRDEAALTALADGFTVSRYDVKWLIRAITATEAYRAASATGPADGPDDGAGAVACRVPLRADQLLGNLIVSLKLPPNAADLGAAGRPGGGAYRASPALMFGTLFGSDPSLPVEERPLTVPQTLFLMNGPMIEKAIDAWRPDLLGGLLREVRQDGALVERLYVSTLGRGPTDGELARCLEHVRRSRSRGDAFEDVLWALVNTAEFRHRR